MTPWISSVCLHLEILLSISVHLCLLMFRIIPPVGSYLYSDVLHTPRAHRIIHLHTTLQNNHHSSSLRLKTLSSTDIHLSRPPLPSHTSSNLYTSYATSSYGCALHNRTRSINIHIFSNFEIATKYSHKWNETHLFNASTAPTITFLPTHNTSTLISSTLSTFPTSPIFGWAPSPGKNCPIPGDSKDTIEYFPMGYAPAPMCVCHVSSRTLVVR